MLPSESREVRPLSVRFFAVEGAAAGVSAIGARAKFGDEAPMSCGDLAGLSWGEPVEGNGEMPPKLGRR